MNLYVSGPVTGIKDDNRPEFERVKMELKRAGYLVTIPHHLIEDIKDITWEMAMMRCIHEFTVQMGWCGEIFPVYEGIAMLDGWEVSRGARIEHDLAVALGIPVKPWREWL